MNELKQLIKASGLKNKFIADKVGISPVELSQYLNGWRPMPEITRVAIKSLLTTFA